MEDAYRFRVNGKLLMKTGSGFDECCCFGFGVLLSHWMDESKCQLEMLADGVIEGLIW